ncbi:MAG TPA: RNA polymerase sigma factor SigJ [Rhizomicrobium sp.]|jgi:RNA polymerase sigma-70 factor (ECF subfamily)
MSDPFLAQRPHLLNIAYRMLGEMAASEDVVQEAWLRWRRVEASEVRDPRAWLSAATVRLALDALRKLKSRRETYVGPWLPEPILPDDARAFAADAPAARAELASDLSLALLHMLERLSPEERAALILHDAFDCDYAEIAAILEKSEDACRKMVARARERVRSGRPKQRATPEQHRDLLTRFAMAAATTDAKQLEALFAPDVVAYTDGGGRVAAALNPIHGADKIIRFFVSLAGKYASQGGVPGVSALDINGEPGLLLTLDGAIFAAIAIECDSDRIAAIYAVRNPEKLGRLSLNTNKIVIPGLAAFA